MEEGAISVKLVEGGEEAIPVADVIKKGSDRSMKVVSGEENPLIGQGSGGRVAVVPSVHPHIDSTSILSEHKISNIDILAESLRKAETMLLCDQSAGKATEQFQGVIQPDAEEAGETVMMPKRIGRPRKFVGQPATPKDKPPKDGLPKRGRGRPKKKVRQPVKRSRESDGEQGTSPKKMKELVPEVTGLTTRGEGGSEEVRREEGREERCGGKE